MPGTFETYQQCASLLALGANGGQPREWLTAEHPGVRGCAALAPALAGDPQALRVLAKLCLAPSAFDQALGYGLDAASPALRHFTGPPRWALIDAACTRESNFRDLVMCAWMVLPRAFRTAPCPELSPYLRAGFPHGWPEAGAQTSAQAAFARVVAGRDELWQTDETARIQTLRMLGLPTDREAWCELAKRPRRVDYSAADLVALQGQMAVRRRPALYLGEGIDRIHPDLLQRLLENLLDAYEQAAIDGEIDGYRLTIESDARVVLAVDGPAFSIEGRPGGPGSSELTRMFTEPHMSATPAGPDAMVQLNDSGRILLHDRSSDLVRRPRLCAEFCGHGARSNRSSPPDSRPAQATEQCSNWTQSGCHPARQCRVG